MRIAVAGGTGSVGRHVVEALQARGHEPVVLSRGEGVDILGGSGLDAALSGAEAVVDVANITTNSKAAAVGFFDKAGRNLTEAARRAGVRHLVTLSIVGNRPGQTGLLRGQAAPGRRSSGRAGCRGRSCRATQFPEFAGQFLGISPGPLTGAGGTRPARSPPAR